MNGDTLTTRITPDTHRLLKVMAALESREMQALLTDAIAAYADEHHPEAASLVENTEPSE